MTIKVGNFFITTPITEILSLLKVELAQQGKSRFAVIKDTNSNVHTNCPFHKDGQERNPSFGILKQNKGKIPAGAVHCFTCGYSADFPTFIGDLFGMGTEFGIDWLVGSKSITNNRDNMAFDVSRDKKRVHTSVSKEELLSYQQEKDPHNYLINRGVSQKILDYFGVGYCKNFLGQGETVTFPVWNSSGEIEFVAHRFIKKKFFHYPENVEKPVYALDKLLNFNGNVVVVESIIDCLTLWSWGIEAIALNGTGTEKQYKEITKMPARCFYTAFDGDFGGRKATERFYDNVKGKLIATIQIPNGKDVNDLTHEQFRKLEITW